LTHLHQVSPIKRSQGRDTLKSLSFPLKVSDTARIELLLDVLNVLNDTAEEGLVDDNLFSQNFGRPNVFIDPRRAMLGVRFVFGR
jgi:hypothetical protein